MRETIRLPRGSIVGQREDRALSDEVRRRVDDGYGLPIKIRVTY